MSPQDDTTPAAAPTPGDSDQKRSTVVNRAHLTYLREHGFEVLAKQWEDNFARKLRRAICGAAWSLGAALGRAP